MVTSYYYYDTVTVHAQVVCRASADCSGAPGDNLGVMTIEECCLETPNGLGFSVGETCSPCIGECMTLWHMPSVKDFVDERLLLCQ